MALPFFFLEKESNNCYKYIGWCSQHHNQEYRNQHEIPDFMKKEGKYVPSGRVMGLRNKLIKFMENHIYSMENEFYRLALSPSRWSVHPVEQKLKELAKREGLWNLFIPVCIFGLLLLLSSCCGSPYSSDCHIIHLCSVLVGDQ